ncbi:MATE family efflux transporter [Beduini massiliensis]|uniref:MATE family efflux transporter n=1 Tax=Beduini massiliensis TaxID=1585974 RepID=UPI00059AA1D0|nr:MATE family efflux transporter [Beduini massiliensis]
MEKNEMGTGKISQLLIKFSVPAIIGMLVNAIYNIVDRMFIGNAPHLGSLGIAGITVSYPVTLILMAVSLMCAVGGATCFSISLGAKREKDASIYIGNALTLAIIFGAVIMIFGNLFINQVLGILGASSNVLPYARSYLSIILYGAVFSCITMCGNNFSRAQGNPKNAMVSQLIGAGFNIAFDYILIFKFNMGMEGAALATIGGQFLSMVWQLAFLFSKRCLIPIQFKSMVLKFEHTKKIITTGVPAFLMQFSNSILNIILNGTLVNYGGDIAISTVGIITSVQTILFMPITGLTQGQQPLISYNFGAKQMSRVKETLKYAIIAASTIAIIGFAVIQLLPGFIITAFNKETDIINLGTNALRIWFLCLPLIGAQICCANYFQAIGKVREASILTLLRQIIILIPMILILSNLFGLYGIFFAVPIADAASFLITTLLTYHQMKQIRTEPEETPKITDEVIEEAQ